MITRKQSIPAALVLLALYLGGYAYARMTHRIVHMQNRAVGPQQVLARPDSWEDIQIDMAKDNPLLETYARGQKGTTGLLNAVFWPLRTVEAKYWNWKHKCGQQAGPAYPPQGVGSADP